MTALDYSRIGHLPFHHRLLINMLAILMLFFSRDQRLTAMMTLLRREMLDMSQDQEGYDELVDTVAYQLKIDGGP